MFAKIPPRGSLERVHKVKLLPVERRFGMAWRYTRRQTRMFKVAVEGAAKPQRVLCGDLRTQTPVCIHAVLRDVGGSALVALRPRGNDRILLDAPEGVPDLHIVPVLHLTEAQI